MVVRLGFVHEIAFNKYDDFCSYHLLSRKFEMILNSRKHALNLVCHGVKGQLLF